MKECEWRDKFMVHTRERAGTDVGIRAIFALFHQFLGNQFLIMMI